MTKDTVIETGGGEHPKTTYTKIESQEKDPHQLLVNIYQTLEADSNPNAEELMGLILNLNKAVELFPESNKDEFLNFLGLCSKQYSTILIKLSSLADNRFSKVALFEPEPLPEEAETLKTIITEYESMIQELENDSQNEDAVISIYDIFQIKNSMLGIRKRLLKLLESNTDSEQILAIVSEVETHLIAEASVYSNNDFRFEFPIVEQ